jgi:hypothetical protein
MHRSMTSRIGNFTNEDRDDKSKCQRSYISFIYELLFAPRLGKAVDMRVGKCVDSVSSNGSVDIQ